MAVVTLEVTIDVSGEIEAEPKRKPGDDGGDNVEAEIGLPHQPNIGRDEGQANSRY